MTGAPIAGILLPQGTLAQPWFVLLATVVAFNTMIYVGLTVSKLIPWPRPVHPERVRHLLRRVGIDVTAVPAAPVSALDIEPPLDDPFEDLRRDIVRRDTPAVLGLLGGTVLLLALASWWMVPELDVRLDLVQVAFGAVLMVLAQTTGRRPLRARTHSTMWAVSTTLLVALLSCEAVAESSPLSIGLAWIVMSAYAAMLLEWRPAIIAGLLMLASTTSAALAMEGHALRYAIIGATALVASGTLLRIRLLAIAALADERLLVRSLGSTDLITGVLSAPGLLSILPVEAGIAQRAGESLCLMHFDVVGLRESNERYGTAYGDEVLRTVAAAIRSVVRAGDLVARWQDDEFVAVGLGRSPAPGPLSERVNARVTASGVTLGKRPVTVRVATTSGDPAVRTFDDLLGETGGMLRPDA